MSQGGATMKKTSRRKTKKRVFKIKEELQQFFPPIDHMRTILPTHWEQVKPATSTKSANKKAVNPRTF